MSECVVRMEMPKGCWDCPCVNGEYGYCQADKEERQIEDPNERPSWCPIIAASPWHRVEEELPEPNIQCLVRDDDGNCAVGYYRQDAKAWDSPFFGWVERDDEYYEDGDLCRIGKVVAWMPIEPPKEEA